jgi:raffinose/stachyose/melibiose transport system substrate-binding protein
MLLISRVFKKKHITNGRNNEMKKRMFGFLSIFITFVMLVACSNSTGSNESDNKNNDKEEVEISFLYQVDDRWTNEMWNEIIQQFEDKNPGVKIKPMSFPSVDKKGEYTQTLYATDQLPDVTFAGIEALKRREGVFYPIPESTYSILQDDALIKKDGKVYTMPTVKYIMLNIFYNKDIFAKYGLTPPNTWDEFLEINETLKKNGVTPLVEAGQGVSGYMLHNPMMTVMLNEIDPDYPQKFLSGEMKFNDPEVIEIAERFQSLWEKGYYHEGSLSYTGAQKDEMFMNGSAAMSVHGIFNAKKYAEGSKFNVGWFTLPGMKSAEMYPVMYDESIGVSAKSKHPDEALKLVEHLFTDEVYQQIIERGNAGFTTNKEFTYEMDYLTKEMYEIVEDKTQKLNFMKIEEFPSVTTELMRSAAQDIAHGGDIKSALTKMENVFREAVESGE